MPPAYDCKLVGDEVFVRSNYSVDNYDYMRIAFKRTVRTPDRRAGVVLPGDLASDLGNLPLYRVSDYADTIPPQTQSKDGLLLPMGRGEAMWIHFISVEPYAVKIYFDGVNAITGKPDVATPESATGLPAGSRQRVENGRPVQDYIVVPGQKGFEVFAVSVDETGQSTATPDLGRFSPIADDSKAHTQIIRLDIIPSHHFKTGTTPVSVCFHGENTVSLMIDPTEKVRDFFRRMATVGFCAETHMVYALCKRIDPKKHFDLPLSDFNIQEYDMFEVFARPVGDKTTPTETTALPTTGDARGKHARDYLPASDWNKDAAVTLNVELLSPEKFRKLNRLETTSTQIIADDYNHHRLAFLSTYKGPSGGSGDSPSLSLADRIERRHTWAAAYWSKDGSLIAPGGPDPSSFRHISEHEANPYT